jgi:hypothetical protein
MSSLGNNRGSWQQPVMSLGALLVAAAVVVFLLGAYTRWQLGEQADAAAIQFRNAAVAASDAHGRLRAAITGENAEDCIHSLGVQAHDDAVGAMQQYQLLQRDAAGLISRENRSDLQPLLADAKQAFSHVLAVRDDARRIARRYQTIMGQYLRYVEFLGATGIALLLGASLTGAFSSGPRKRR